MMIDLQLGLMRIGVYLKIEPGTMLCFDDVLLKQQFSDIPSRSEQDVCLDAFLTDSIKISSPIIASNMSTVCEYEMINDLDSIGAVGFLHRAMDRQEMQKQITSFNNPGIISIGIGDDPELLPFIACNKKIRGVVIDTAHGQQKRVVDRIKLLKAEFPDLQVIAGNVSEGEGYKLLCDAGADAVRVGVGSGGICSTRAITGTGYPVLASISSCNAMRQELLESGKKAARIICDGGLRTSGDCAKALAAGADTVMSGFLFKGCKNTPGPVVNGGNGKSYKSYIGMASKEAGEKMRGGSYNRAPEGISANVPYVDKLGSEIVTEIMHALRSSLTYSGSRNIQEFQEKAVFIKCSPLAMAEHKTLND